MSITPYLFFDGRGDEQLEFYKTALGAEIGMLMRFKDAPDQSRMSPEAQNKVMHVSFKIGDTTIMGSDGYNKGKPEYKGVALSINAKDEADAERLFKALSEGGQVQMPLDKTFFAKRFGMLADKFGVSWMIIAE
jgi:PhnB protein